MVYIYIATSSVYFASFIVKIGCTENPQSRRSTYLTGCPPGLTPSCDIEYDSIWETNAIDRNELYDYEEQIHNQFHKYRMIRNIPGDSEWFRFQDKHTYDMLVSYLKKLPWVIRQVPLSEILLIKSPLRYLQKNHCKNLSYIRNRNTRDEVLNDMQKPVITKIVSFMNDDTRRAGIITTPCGSGKTIMTIKAMTTTRIRKCVICCPTNPIQKQWEEKIISNGTFLKDDIHIIGNEGTTDEIRISEIFDKDVYCIITTYRSSHLLLDKMGEIQLLVLDEAHHMVGIVSTTDDKGEGITRKLMKYATENRIKRLSLTYTPRYIFDGSKIDVPYLTMNDEAVFGITIAELKLRAMIDRGVLPDYRLWTLRDESNKGNGIIGKAECILESWNAREVIRGEEKYILDHLIVFASTIEDVRMMETFFKERTTYTTVLRVESGSNTEDIITQFSYAPRSILVNCLVLNEGVDIPIANAVAITYPKQSRGQITQMILRAGRWYENKSLFHILIPIMGDEDLTGFEEVLYALASCDEKIVDEITVRSNQNADLSELPRINQDTGNIVPENIMIEEFSADQKEIIRCFNNIKNKLFSTTNITYIQEQCRIKQIDTSIEYKNHRVSHVNELPDDPRPKNMTWYDFLHLAQTNTQRISASEFVKTILEPNNLKVAHIYDEWRKAQPSDIRQTLPSVQHITDGFFGMEHINFNTILNRFGTNTHTRRR